MRKTTSPARRLASGRDRRRRFAPWTAVAAAVLAAGLPAWAEPYEPPRPAPAPGPGADRGDAAVVDLQRQVNDLRSELLDERERRIERWQEANGFVLVFLGVAIGIGGPWAYAKFRSIADQASIGAAAARRYMAMPPDPLPRNGLPRGQLGNSSGPFPHLVAASPELTPAFAPRGEAVAAAGRFPGGTADADAQAGSGPDADELQRHEEAIADCSETIRLDPRNPALYLERAEARSAVGRFEEALADYDRAIRLHPDHAAAYLGRCCAKSELGRLEEAVEDYDRAVQLDPDSAAAVAAG